MECKIRSVFIQEFFLLYTRICMSINPFIHINIHQHSSSYSFIICRLFINQTFNQSFILNLCICLAIYLFLFASLSVFIYLSISSSIHSYVYLSIYLAKQLSVYMIDLTFVSTCPLFGYHRDHVCCVCACMYLPIYLILIYRAGAKLY